MDVTTVTLEPASNLHSQGMSFTNKILTSFPTHLKLKTTGGYDCHNFLIFANDG